MGETALRHDEALADDLEAEPGVETGRAVAGVAPQHLDPFAPEAVDGGGDQEPAEAVALAGPVDGHAPEVDGRPSGAMGRGFGAKAGHGQPTVAPPAHPDVDR